MLLCLRNSLTLKVTGISESLVESFQVRSVFCEGLFSVWLSFQALLTVRRRVYT